VAKIGGFSYIYNKVTQVSDLTRAFIDIIGCGSAIQASLIAFALHDDSARPC
jgi:hypothetical protein